MRVVAEGLRTPTVAKARHRLVSRPAAGLRMFLRNTNVGGN